MTWMNVLVFVAGIAMTVGGLLSAVLFVPSDRPFVPPARLPRSFRLRLLIFPLLTGTLATIAVGSVTNGCFLPDTCLAFTIPLFGLVLCFRLVRLKRGRVLTASVVNALTLSDFAVIGYWIWYLDLLGKANIVHSHPLSPVTSFGIPFFYLLCSTYIVFNVALLAPGFLRLAAWRLQAYAFPEAQEHNRVKIRGGGEAGLQILDFLGWLMFGLTVLSGLLLGMWATRFRYVLLCYLMGTSAAGLTCLFTNWRRHTVGRWRSVLGGTGLISTAYLLLVCVSHGSFEIPRANGERFVAALPIASSFALFAIQFVTELPGTIATKVKETLYRFPALREIADTVNATHAVVFRRSSMGQLQALIVASVFLLYLFLPRCQFLLELTGITTLFTMPLDKFTVCFVETAQTWSLPSDGSLSGMATFVFGNQGLILMMLLWYIACIMTTADAPSTIERVPHLLRSKGERFFAGIHVVLFGILFFPFLLTVALLIPIFAVSMVGFPVAIVLGAFCFVQVIPRLISVLLGIGYLVVSLLNTVEKRDQLDINTSPVEDLARLPGIGRQLARRIVENRPYQSVDELIRVKGIGENTLAEIKALVRMT